MRCDTHLKHMLRLLCLVSGNFPSLSGKKNMAASIKACFLFVLSVHIKLTRSLWFLLDVVREL